MVFFWRKTMKSTLFAALLITVTEIAYAGDLLESLRQLSGTMDQVSKASRELNNLKNAVAPGTATEARPTQQPQQPASTASAVSAVQAGDVLFGKVANVKVYRDANKQSTALGQIAKSEELIYMGEEQNGLYKVTSSSGEGWVDKLLVKKN
jgi:hypothetical protein